MSKKTPPTHTHTPPYPPCATEVATEGRYGSACKSTLITLADVQPVRPVTRFLARTREVVLLDGRGASRGYHVDLDRVRDGASLLGWIEHLSLKRWVNGQHIVELIRHAEQQNGIKVNRGV